MGKKIRHTAPPTFVQGSHRRDRPYTPAVPNGESGYRNSVFLGNGFTIRDLSDALVRSIAASQTNRQPGSRSKQAKFREHLFEQAALGENAVISRSDLQYIDVGENINLDIIVLQFECELEKLLGIYPNIPFER